MRIHVLHVQCRGVFFVMKIFGIRETKRNFTIIPVMMAAGGRTGTAQSCPVSSYLNYEFQNREEVANNVTCTFYSWACIFVWTWRGVCLCIHLTVFFSLFAQIVFSWLHPSLCTCKKTQKTKLQQKNPLLPKKKICSTS